MDLQLYRTGSYSYTFDDLPMLANMAKRMIDAAKKDAEPPAPTPQGLLRPKAASDTVDISPNGRALATSDILPRQIPAPIPGPTPRFDEASKVPREAPGVDPVPIPAPAPRQHFPAVSDLGSKDDHAQPTNPFEGPSDRVGGSYKSDPKTGAEIVFDGNGITGTFDADGNITIGDFKGSVTHGNKAIVTNEKTGESYEFRYASGEGRFSFYGIKNLSEE